MKNLIVWPTHRTERLFLAACAVATSISACSGGSDTVPQGLDSGSGVANVGDTETVVLLDTSGATGLDTPEIAPTEPDVAGSVDASGCLGLGCSPSQTCAESAPGVLACFEATTLTESFDTTEHRAPETTALWGSGSLTVDGGAMGGSGQDGDFAPTTDVTVDTTTKGTFDFLSYTIPAGVTVTVVGSNPYVVRVVGDLMIDGVLQSDGQPGRHACGKPDGSLKPPALAPLEGGLGGAGGGAGGASGSAFGQNGQPGAGPGGGAGSMGASDPNSLSGAGAGGGSFGGLGGLGTGMISNGYAGGPGAVYADPKLVTLVGGSGGGGGAGKDAGGNDGTCPGCPVTTNCYLGTCAGTQTYDGDGVGNTFDRPGGSGGGGGGAISLSTAATITIRGRLSADGGDGGWGDFSGAGGGGSGGAIRLSALGEVHLDGGTLSALGGHGAGVTCSNQWVDARSGAGGDGRILVESVTGLGQGFLIDPEPPPSFATPSVVLDGGSGKDGAFAPDADVTLNSDAGPFEYTSFLLPKGVTLHATGSLPLAIRCQGAINLLGDIDLSGMDGETGYSACCGNPHFTAKAGAGGQGGAGGFWGGAGGAGEPGTAGGGPGGAPGGAVAGFSSAGGAGHVAAGGNGGPSSCTALGPSGGAAYGEASLQALVGGSGGGGAGDSNNAACQWCQGGKCVTDQLGFAACPTSAICDGFCSTLHGACEATTSCTATDRWNPGSGGGGGGGALALESTGLLLIDGGIRLNGGNGGDSRGSSEANDGTCGASCVAGCYEGTCGPAGGGSFGGSGGGGSGGALRVRGLGLRATGGIEARGGRTGHLNQGGGCALDPDDHDPQPGQGRGGNGSVGRIRIETLSPTGSVLIGNGSFARGKSTGVFGTLAVSTWYALPGEGSRIESVTAPGLGPKDTLEWSVAPMADGGGPDEAQAAPWSATPTSAPGGFVRFRIQLLSPKDGASASSVSQVSFEVNTPAP